jgi:hypothetical protein
MTATADSESPPVDFPLYGLDDSWPGPRWLEFVDGRIGEPTWGIRLGHQRPAADAYLGVAALPRTRYDHQCVSPGADRLGEVAFYGTHWLINITLPEPHVPRPDGFLRSLVAHETDQATRHAQWPEVTWSVDEHPIPASVWRFAGGWTAFTDGLPDSYLIAAGFGTGPDGLRFTTITDSARYGFDSTAPLRLADLTRARDRNGPDVHARVNTDHFHADQLTLMSSR